MKISTHIIARRTCLPRLRPSFTLVELLVAVAIIGIMSGMVLFALLSARTDARNARTRGTIQKISEIILQRWEEYRYRPLNVNLPFGASTPTGSPPVSPVSPRENARLRMVILRDTMRMEMPDRITDLLYPPTQYTVSYVNPAPPPVLAAGKLSRKIPGGFGVIYRALRNRIISLQNSGSHPQWAGFNLVNLDTHAVYSTGTVPATAPVSLLTTNTASQWHNAVQSSELLYLLVSSSNYGGSSALEFFRPSEVGDPDNDGLLEFIDAWGQPILWIRWPAGYPGDLVRYADDDAMDPLKSDWRYRPLAGMNSDWRPRTLVPLILSSGADGQLGVIANFNFNDADQTPFAYATMTWPGTTTGKPFGTSGAHYAAPPYFYPDPNFTWDYQNAAPNTTGSEMPYPDDPVNFPRGYRANQIGAIPRFLDSGLTIENTFATDNITNHDIILEP